MRTDLLRTLAASFGSNSVLAAKAIREMHRLDPAGFPAAVAEVLGSGPELPGAQFLIAVLVAETDWLRTVCNPEKYTREQSLDLVRRAHKLDPSTELKLAKLLVPLKFATEEESRFATRILEILERSPDPSTSLPALRQLAQCPNAHVRSKAALLMGRISRNPQWAEQTASETDPRVSGNAVESLWGLDSPAAREAFLHAARHAHHRIAANGMVGLYLVGHPSSIPLLFKLSGSNKPLARAAAAWAMGHVGDPRFIPRLARLMEDSDPVTRKAAFRSVSRVRQQMTVMRAAGALRVQFQDAECRRHAHLIRFLLTKDDQPVNGLDLRQFVVWNGPDLVEGFSVKPPAGTVRHYEIAYQGPPSPTQLVKVQAYAAVGVGEDTGLEKEFD
jgi:predicted metal-dependent enzyme (double-stranded beta helix superfamily)